MRIKIFQGRNFGNPQYEISEWLSKNEDIEIKHIAQSESCSKAYGSMGHSTTHSLTISIWYEFVEDEC